MVIQIHTLLCMSGESSAFSVSIDKTSPHFLFSFCFISTETLSPTHADTQHTPLHRSLSDLYFKCLRIPVTHSFPPLQPLILTLQHKNKSHPYTHTNTHQSDYPAKPPTPANAAATQNIYLQGQQSVAVAVCAKHVLLHPGLRPQ